MSDSRPRERNEVSPLLPWGTAVLSVVAAFGANRIIPNGIFPAPFYIAAVMITAQVGGWRPGLLSFGLASALLDYFDMARAHPNGCWTRSRCSCTRSSRGFRRSASAC
jgi:hypothetical protein